MTVKITTYAMTVAGRVHQKVDADFATAAQLHFFLHNWLNGALVESRWMTDVTRATTLTEERRSLLDRPHRDIEVFLVGLDKQETFNLQNVLQKITGERTMWPLYTDFTRGTQPITADTITCDTTYRRFFNGGRVAIVEFGANRSISQIEYATIDYVQDDKIVLTEDTTLDFNGVQRVYPIFYAEITRDTEIEFLTPDLARAIVSLREIDGPSALGRTAFESPTAYPVDSATGKPIFVIEERWANNIRKRLIRAGQDFNSGRAKIVHTAGDRFSVGYTVDLYGFDRQQCWDFIQHFDNVKGRYKPFYYAMPELQLEFQLAGPGFVTATAYGTSADYSSHTHVILKLKDGTTHVRPIENLIVAVGDVSITWTEDIPGLSNADIASAHFGIEARFSQDFIREQWETDDSIDLQFGIEELQRETDVSVGCFLPSFEFNLGAIPAPEMWFDASRNVYANSARGLLSVPSSTRFKAVSIWDDVRQTPSPSYIQALGGIASSYEFSKYDTGSEDRVQGMPVIDTPDSAETILQYVNGNGAKIWTDDGFTFVAVFYSNDFFSTQEFLRIEDPSSDDCLRIASDRTRWYSSPDTEQEATNIGEPADNTNHIMVVRWRGAGLTGSTYLNGNTLQATTAAAVDIPGTGPFTYTLLSRLQQISAILLWDHDIGQDNINAVCDALARRYSVNWTDII